MQPQDTIIPERWLPVVGYEGLYEVSDLGRVRRAKRGGHTRPGLILRPRLNRAGRPYVNLYGIEQRRTHLVHRLVAEAFLGPCPPKHEANHKNGVKADNRVGNLEWITLAENHRHAAVTGLMASGERHPNAKLTEIDVREIRAARGQRTQEALGRQFSVSQAVISAIQRRATWKHIP